MKSTLELFLTCLGMLIVFNASAQRAKEGNVTISAPNTVVNTYTKLTATATAGSSTLTVTNSAMNGGAFTTPLAPGDLVMVIQMQGAIINCDTTTVDQGWGPYTVPAPYMWSNSWQHHIHEWGALIHLDIFANPTNGYGNSGKFEQVEVLSITNGTTIELGCDLVNTYDGLGHSQIVRVPRYDTLIITNTGSIIPNVWDGTTGGIVAIEANSHLDINAGGLISADVAGFRGGQLDDDGTVGSTGNTAEVRFLGSSDPFEGSEKGEGIHGYTTELEVLHSRYGISGASNGGGGGGYQNAGGGGGSNVYAGGIRYTGTGVPNPIYNVHWALDISYPDFNLDPQTYSNLVGRPSPGGGRGGYALSENDANENVIGPRNAIWGGDARKTNGGRGGHPLIYDATRLFLGGGGGAGDQDSDQGGAGGAGGGIVYITTYGTFIGDGTISANGADGQKTNPLNQDPGAATGNRRKGNDGAGGAGAGGSIFIENAVAIPATIVINAIGGDGGNQDMRLFKDLAANPFPINTTDEAAGPGGAGGGGNIAFNSGTPTQNVSAGSAGIITSQTYEFGAYTVNAGMMGNMPVNGATDGYVGEASLAAPYFDIVGTDVTICAGQSTNLTVSILGAYPPGSNATDITWYTQQFCDPSTNIQGTGLTINVTPAVTTTYWVGLCPSKFRIPVTVTVSLGANLVIADPTALCAPATVDITAPVITAGSDIGTITYWTDVTLTTTNGTPSTSGAGWHVVMLDIGGGCTAVDSILVTINPLDDASFTTSDFCASLVNVISAVANPGGTYVITGQTGSGLVTVNGATGVLSNFVAGDQVTIQYTTPASGCQNLSSQVVNVLPADDASFTTVDFCISSVNTISAVAIPGGAYVITGQTGSGLATINGATGVLSNYVAGDQITIQYTTPAGGCQNSSTQIVNVTPLDDASFTTSDFCASLVNVISAVANPGGTYVITGQTGSGLVTINGATGVLANYVVGDQITIEYTTPAGGCQNTSTQVVNVTPLDDASFTSVDFCASTVNTISAVSTAGGTYTITGQTGSGLATINGATGVLANYVVGDQITIQYLTLAGGCQNSSTQVVTVLAEDDPAFTSVDFCFSTVNTISGVAVPGGTYVITTQTGSGLATINGATGVLANYVAGDQVTIQYTTPAGGCQNSSLQVVNVTPLDDATFTSVDFCASTVNTISAVALPGGTYTITGQTGSGLATINGATGVLANYVAGDQVTIQYQTAAGGCQNTSTQVVNVMPVDDASFTTVDFCASLENIVSAVALPGGTYVITSQTGSGLTTINAGTGTLAGFVAGDQVTIQYTTPAGGCQNSSSQIVNVLPEDDASFTTVDFCEASVNTISAVAIPGGTYVITVQTGSGTVTIDGNTGVLSNYVAGDQVTIEYTTPAGGCQNTSTQVVNVTAQDDASFVTTDFCESSVNTIGSVAIPNGTYAIQTQTGTATIDTNTGVLSGYVAGDQITIEYTTPAGVCQNTSTQVVNVTPDDDGTFTMTATCDGGEAVVTGLAGGTFIFTNGPLDAAVLDGSTGIITGGTENTTYDITYTTNGACPVSVQQSIVVLLHDDSTFYLTPTCDGAIATVTGTAGGTFTFNTAPSDAASINSNTGDVTGGDYNSTYSIQYVTAGLCPTSSIELVTAMDCSVSFDIVIPTAFTPGGDATNNEWEIQGLDNKYPDNSVIVYNRWGSVVFEFTSSAGNPYALNRWDGTFKGQDLPVASYYFIISANDGSNDEYKGTVTIVRN